MLSWRVRAAVAFCATGVILMGSPTKSHAIFDWLCPWSKKQQTTATTYVPPFSGRPAAQAPQTLSAPVVVGVPRVGAAMPTTCSYVPQTAYRTAYRQVPVTSYVTATCYDPCTGCPRVTYRPVTSWAYRTVLEPYTTYRIVYSNRCCPTTPYAGAWGGSGTVSGAGCSSCAPSAGPSPRIAPVPMSGAPAPTSPFAGSIAPALTPNGWGSLAPVAPAASRSEGARGTNLPWPETRQRPAAEPNAAVAPPRAPELNAPNEPATAVPLRQASYTPPASPSSEAGFRVTRRLDATGWQPAK